MEAIIAQIVVIVDDAVILIDQKQEIIFFNKGAEQMFGYAAEEVIGKPLTVMMPERFRHIHPTHVKKFASGGEKAKKMGERRDIYGRRKNGREFRAQASIARLKLGHRQLAMVIMRDVSSGVDAVLREMAENSRDLIAFVDKSGRFDYVNSSYTRILGYPTDELIGKKKFSELTSGPVEYSRSADNTQAYNVQITAKDGSKIWIECDPYTVETGPVAEIIVARDITRKRKIDAGVHEVIKSARGQVSALSQMFRTVESAIIMLDRVWRFQYINTFGMKQMGIKEDPMGKVIWDLFPQLESSSFGESMKEAMEELKPKTFEDYYEPRGLWYATRMYPVSGGMVMHISDISEIKKLRQSQEDVTDMLERMMDMGPVRPDLRDKSSGAHE